MSKPLEYDPVYLDRDVVKLLKAWPSNENEAVYRRLVDAAVIGTKYEDFDRIKEPLLTQLGHAFVGHVRDRDLAGSPTTETFFPLERVLQCWPLELLSERFAPVKAFLSLFDIDFNTADVRRYVAANLGTKGREKHGFWDRPGEATRLHVVKTLDVLLAELHLALMANLGARWQEYRRLDPEAWRKRLEQFDAEIPF